MDEENRKYKTPKIERGQNRFVTPSQNLRLAAKLRFVACLGPLPRARPCLPVTRSPRRMKTKSAMKSSAARHRGGIVWNDTLEVRTRAVVAWALS